MLPRLNGARKRAPLQVPSSPRHLPCRDGGHTPAPFPSFARKLRRTVTPAGAVPWTRMQDWSVPLAIATASFLAFVLFRVRPTFTFGPFGRARAPKAPRERLRIAKERAQSAPDPHARAIALCDAADIVGRRLAGKAAAASLYQRALRADPASVEIVRRVAAGLATRPRSLESLLWRHLGASPWTGSAVEAVRAALEALRSLYDGPLRNASRARALSHAKDALQPGAQNTLGSA
jgi:hypothetical protein